MLKLLYIYILKIPPWINKFYCIVLYETNALSILPPTRIIPSLSSNGLSVFSSLAFTLTSRPFWASFIQKIRLFSSSSGVSDSSSTAISLIGFILASKFFFILSTHAVTLTSLPQRENLSQSITPVAVSFDVTVPTACVFLHSLSTSSWSAFALSIGHSSFGRSRNAGPFFHLPDNSATDKPRDTSSATLCSVGMCLHWTGWTLVCISPTRLETNGLSLFPLLRIHA